MAPTCYPRCGKARKDSTNDVHLLVMPPPVPVRSVLASHRRDRARRCSLCPFRSTTSPTCGPCSGRVRNESAGRTLLRPMRSAPRSGRIERRQTQREGNCDHETDDYHGRLRRRGDVSCVNKLAGSSCAAARPLCGRLLRRDGTRLGVVPRVWPMSWACSAVNGGQLHAP
jgi:hypothetical protein